MGPQLGSYDALVLDGSIFTFRLREMYEDRKRYIDLPEDVLDAAHKRITCIADIVHNHSVFGTENTLYSVEGALDFTQDQLRFLNGRQKEYRFEQRRRTDNFIDEDTIFRKRLEGFAYELKEVRRQLKPRVVERGDYKRVLGERQREAYMDTIALALSLEGTVGVVHEHPVLSQALPRTLGDIPINRRESLLEEDSAGFACTL